MQESPGSFESLYQELELIVRRLEAGDLPLAESLTLFERGAALSEQCNALLDQAELRVRLLTSSAVADDAGGNEETIHNLPEFEDWQQGG